MVAGSRDLKLRPLATLVAQDIHLVKDSGCWFPERFRLGLDQRFLIASLLVKEDAYVDTMQKKP